MKTINFAVVSMFLIFGSLSQASPQCNFGGLQVALRNGADALHPNNPVRYIDFANDAPFSYALARMAAVGVEPIQVETAWLNSIKNLCGPRAANLTIYGVGPGIFKLVVRETNAEQILVQLGSGQWIIGNLEPLGNNKYTAHYPGGKKNTFWYFSTSRTLGLYDAATGFVKYRCN